MAVSGAPPLIWHALKKKSGRRSSGGTTGVRQQKEELVHSVKNNPRSISLRVGSHSGSAVHSAAPPSRPPLLLFLFWTVHGPFARFLLEEKPGPPRGLPRGERRKERSRAQSSPLGGDGVGGVSSDDMGGAKDQPSSWLNPPPPVRASTGSRLDPDPFLPL